MMRPAERVTAMVPVATVPGIGEDYILVLIVAYPIPAAFGLYQIPCLTAQATSGLWRRFTTCTFLRSCHTRIRADWVNSRALKAMPR